MLGEHLHRHLLQLTGRLGQRPSRDFANLGPRVPDGVAGMASGGHTLRAVLEEDVANGGVALWRQFDELHAVVHQPETRLGGHREITGLRLDNLRPA
jgi:hypothetical protein